MSGARITITLTQRERSALMKLAEAELRSDRDQARHILRLELGRLGLLRLEPVAQKQEAA